MFSDNYRISQIIDRSDVEYKVLLESVSCMVVMAYFIGNF
jgi:hypothetical protein